MYVYMRIFKWHASLCGTEDILEEEVFVRQNFGVGESVI